MMEVKFDMCGAASVLGAMKAASLLQLPLNVIVLVSASENLPGPDALKPGDIIESYSKKTIEVLRQRIGLLKQKLENERNKVVKPVPNKDTGEVPLRTGVAAAILDKNGPKPKVDKEDNRKKLKMSLGKSKIEVDPDVEIGQISGGIQTGTGNLH